MTATRKQTSGGSRKILDVKELALRLLKEKTERDKQTFIGASSFGSPCSYCIARELLGLKDNTPSKYWLAAVIGTAVHGLIEEREAELLDPDDTVVEKKILLGTLEGYSDIYSKPDVYIESERAVVDWKTTSRDKLKWLKEAMRYEATPQELSKVTEARFTLVKYKNQALSYGRGLVLAGYPVDSVHLCFICRDGKTDDDIWPVDFDYDQQEADDVWDRLIAIWEYVRDGGDISEIASHFNCYQCQVKGR